MSEKCKRKGTLSMEDMRGTTSLAHCITLRCRTPDYCTRRTATVQHSTGVVTQSKEHMDLNMSALRNVIVDFRGGCTL